MTFKVEPRVRETSVTTGVGDYTLAGAPVGFQPFSVLGANNTCSYYVTDNVNWEEGIGTVLTAPARLQRTIVTKSSIGGVAINWGAGAKTVICGWTGTLKPMLELLTIDPQAIVNLKPTFAAAANALTITMKDRAGADLSVGNPGLIAQRDSAIGDGGFNVRPIPANVAMTISSGSTLGHTSARLCPIYIYLLDNAGAQELAVAGTFQGESGIYSTTGEGGGGAADNPDVMYSTTARANVPGRLVAIAWSNQAAAGTWLDAPTEVKQRPFHLERVGKQEVYMGGAIAYGSFAGDGANVSRTTYAKLFSKIGTTWGVGDGSTTFGLPDSRRRVDVGSGGTGTGTLGNAVGNVGGAETHTLTAAEAPVLSTSDPGNHTHSSPIGPTTGGSSRAELVQNDTAASSPTNVNSNAAGAHTHVVNAGGGGAHPIMQPSMVVTKTIRWLGDI